MYREFLCIAAACLADSVSLRFQTRFFHLVEQREVVLVHFGPFLLIFVVQVVFDGFGGNGGLANRRGQQVRTYDIARGKVPRTVGNLVVLVTVDQVALVGVVFQTAHVATLADGRDDQIGFNDVFLAAFDARRGIVFPFAVGQFQRSGTAGVIAHDLNRHDLVHDGDTFLQRVVDLVLGGGHLIAGKQGGQGDVLTGDFI